MSRRMWWPAFMLLAGCSALSETNETKNMNTTALPPKLQKMFEKTKPVCFGRFLIDVPEDAHVIFGRQDFGPKMQTIENGSKDLRKFAIEKRREIETNKKEGAEVTEFKEGPTFGSWIVAFWEDHAAKEVGLERIFGFLNAAPNGFVYPGGVSERFTREQVLDRMNYIATNLRARRPDEIPSDPGVCLDLGFIRDDTGKFQEIFGVGFHFPSFPDVSFSALSNKDRQTGTSLSEKRRDAERAVRGTELEAEFRKIKLLREGRRRVFQWDGEEALARRPNNVHEFVFDYPGKRYDKNNPSLDVRMYTGVKENKTGQTAPNLSDEEAVLLWDRLLSTLRLRTPIR